MPAYATKDDLAQWVDADLPANSTAILRTAEYAIREATEMAWYAADPVSGLPTDPGVLLAFNQATCAQAAALITLGIDPLAGGASAAGVEQEVALGSARVTYADAAQAAEARRMVEGGICTEASRILRQAGIRLNWVWVVG